MVSLKTSIDIAVPAERVWMVLTDFASYGDWNPFIQRIVGAAQAGEKLSVRIRGSEGRIMTFHPQLTVVEASGKLCWLNRVPWLFKGEHYFFLEPTESGGTRLLHGENLSGLLSWLLSQKVKAEALANFEAMNAALKQRAESARGS